MGLLSVQLGPLWSVALTRGHCRGHCGWLEEGHCGQLVPPDRLPAQVKVLQPQRDSAQVVVLPQGLGTEHAQLELPQAQRLLAEAVVHQLWRERRSGDKIFTAGSFVPHGPSSRFSAGFGSALIRTLRRLLTISLKVGFLVFLEILVLRLEVLCGSGSR